jgi:hypothetical protein
MIISKQRLRLSNQPTPPRPAPGAAINMRHLLAKNHSPHSTHRLSRAVISRFIKMTTFNEDIVSGSGGEEKAP